MTSNEKKRATLDFGDFPTNPAPAIDPKAVKEATRAAGFRETPKPAAPAISPRTLRRTRRRTGRTEQFATRLRAETLEAIYSYADKHEITLAETIERAMRALMTDENKG